MIYVRGQEAVSSRAAFSSQAAPLGPVNAPNASREGGLLSLKVTAVLQGAGPRRGKL